MSASDNSTGAQISQAQFEILMSTMAALMAMIGPSAPAIIGDGIYTRDQVEKNLRVSDKTVTDWIEFNGLKPLDEVTKKHFFYGRDLIDWMRKPKDGMIKPKDGRERAAMRKAKADAKAPAKPGE